jgi:hypothetical protein
MNDFVQRYGKKNTVLQYNVSFCKNKNENFY